MGLRSREIGAEVDKVKQDVKPRALQAERQQWTTFFTALPHPPQMLFGRTVREADDLPQRITDATKIKVPDEA